MKILLITNYWHPYNNSGTFRWLYFSKYIKFDVLTSRKPKRSFQDESIPVFRHDIRIFRIGGNLPAFISGWILSINSLRYLRAYNIFIFTSPPESLIFGAYFLQLLGKKVVIDLRDKIDRPNQPNKFLNFIYNFFYKRMKNRIVSMNFFDENASGVIRNGTDYI